jgi:hypothetical protein
MTTVTVLVRELQTNAPISGAPVTRSGQVESKTTNEKGILVIKDVPEGSSRIKTEVFGVSVEKRVTIRGTEQMVELEPDLGLTINVTDESRTGIPFAVDGAIVNLEVTHTPVSTPGTSSSPVLSYNWTATAGELVQPNQSQAFWHTLGAVGQQTIGVTLSDSTGVSVTPTTEFKVLRSSTSTLSGDAIPVNLGRSQVPQTRDQMLWVTIRNRTKAISFSGSGYADFINAVLCRDETGALSGRNSQRLTRQRDELYEPIHGVGAYELLKTATQIFLLMECGTNIEEVDRYTGETIFDAEEETRRLGRSITLDEAQSKLAEYLGEGRLPYINRVLRTAFGGRSENDSVYCEGIIAGRANCPPLLELIWSYWHEEAMLVQAMKAISLRFQNRRSKSERDPLAHLEIAPLYPLNNLLWGYLQDEINTLSVTRRNYEYNHHYGLNLQGAAVSDFRPADPRSRFLEGFHNLLQQTTRFYKQDDDTTFLADGFPLLNSLREVHLVLSEGAHNQFGDLPWTARAEMLMQQWLLSRPELREFLQSRAMVPYRESWMPQVDTMKQLQGWTDVSVTHFNYLAVYGERILLSIRYGDWVEATDPVLAANWARYWRPEIQNYIHSYRAATGVDLAAEAKDSRQEKQRVMQPSLLLKERLNGGQPVPNPNGSAPATSRFRERRAANTVSTGGG